MNPSPVTHRISITTLITILKQHHKCPPYFTTTQAVDVKVESKVKKFKVVSNSTENLKTKIIIQLGGEQDGEDGCRGGAEHEQDNDGDQD